MSPWLKLALLILAGLFGVTVLAILGAFLGSALRNRFTHKDDEAIRKAALNRAAGKMGRPC